MRAVVAGVLLAALALSIRPAAAPPDACAPPAWRSERVVRVSNVRALDDAVAAAQPGDMIMLADGTYALTRTLNIGAPRVTLRGASGDRAKVVIRGQGMTGDSVGVGIGVNSPDVTIANLTVGNVGLHGVQVRGEQGAERSTLFNVRIMDTGQQLLKGSVSEKPVYGDNGLVACSEFSYTDSAPSNYTDGVDLLATRGWTIRDNRFLRIRGPRDGGWSSGPAILVWAASEDTVVERNVIVDSFRGVAFGLGPAASNLARGGEKTFDHRGGVIRNNVIVNLNPWADEAIEANAARDVRIEHNTVLVEGSALWSIGVRFDSATALVRNNLTSRQILLRNGGHATTQGNVIARRAWFADPAGADLRILPASRMSVRVGEGFPDAPADFDGRPRPSSGPVDVGAFESGGSNE